MRKVAEQKLANWLYKAKKITIEDDIQVVKLDWNQPFTILLNGNRFATCSFNGFIYNNICFLSQF